MSKMKHLLRKLHIGGNNPNDHHQRLPENRHASSSSSSSSSTSSSSASSSSSSAAPARARAADGGAGELRRAGGDGEADFNFFEEEFQVQLALAISASDPNGREDPETAQIKAAKRISLGCTTTSSASADETLVEFLSLRYWVRFNFRVFDMELNYWFLFLFISAFLCPNFSIGYQFGYHADYNQYPT